MPLFETQADNVIKKQNKIIKEQQAEIAQLKRDKQILIDQHDMWKSQWEEVKRDRDIANNKLIDCTIKITELEKELNETKNIIVAHQVSDETGYIDGYGWVANWSEMEAGMVDLFKAHNLRQQAKGVEDLVEYHTISDQVFTFDCGQYINVDAAIERVKKLTERADELEQGDE